MMARPSTPYLYRTLPIWFLIDLLFWIAKLRLNNPSSVLDALNIIDNFNFSCIPESIRIQTLPQISPANNCQFTRVYIDKDMPPGRKIISGDAKTKNWAGPFEICLEYFPMGPSDEN